MGSEIDGAEEPALESVSKYYRFLDSAPDGMFLVAEDGRIDFVNAQCEQLFGYTKSELHGQKVEMLVPHAQREQHTKHRQSVTANPQRRAMGQGRSLLVRRKDGSEFQADISLAPVETETGLMTGVAVRDVTEQLKLEGRLREVQRLESVGRLAGGIAHDFNNLLTAIASFGSFVFETLEPLSPAAHDMEEVLHATERAKQLTEKLLEFSRQRTIRPRNIVLNQTVEALDRMLRRLLGEGIDYCTQLKPDLWTVWVDPAAIEQVIVNLALNARDAMDARGKLTIETGNAVLGPDYAKRRGVEIPAGEYVMIAITDDGIGMDTATQSRIFEPFFTTKAEGTGLGLATSYGIVKQAGGYVWVYSEPGRGTTLKVYLPRVADKSEQAAVAPPAPAPARGTETVLIAEDENQVRAAAARSLERLGYTVLRARSGAEALELSEQHTGPIHLLLTDVVMPGMNGKELARQAALSRPELKVLYMSGYTANVIVHHGVLDPGVELVQKPFTPELLSQHVRRILDAGSKH